MEFKVLDSEGLKIARDIQSRTEYNGCEYQYSYLNAWVSREPSCLKYAVEDGIFYIMFKCTHMPIKRGERLFLPPLATLDKISDAYIRLKDYTGELGENLSVIAAPQEHIEMLDKEIFDCEKIENADEYLYNTSDLADLPGKKYHAKRNHIAKFNRAYKYIFRAFEDSDKAGILTLYSTWQENKSEYDSREEYAITNMLDKRVEYGLKCGVIEIDGKIIAFSISEVTANKRGIVHFEKADIGYDGAYSVINNETAKNYLNDTVLINRQEDMGLEGLRKAKLSYYPIGYCEKWMVRSKN